MTDGYEIERILKSFTMWSWCSEGHDQRIHINRPYAQSPDTVRITIECVYCDEISVIEVKA